MNGLEFNFVMTSEVLITGGSGLLGSNLVKLMEKRYSVHSIAYRHLMQFGGSQVHQLNITEGDNLLELVRKIKPECIIHTAALTEVDYCETHRDEAWKMNVQTTRNVVKAAAKTHSTVFYISTDSVFDGKKGMYTEEDIPNPLNFYAATKLEGENAVSESCVNHVIIRTNIYGWNAQRKLSIAEWMLSGLREKKRLTLFRDVFFTPILVNNLADAITEILEKNLSGLFHVAGSERCSKLQFGLELASVFGLDKNLIEPIQLGDKNLVAQRPKDPSLSIRKIEKEIKTKLLNVREGLEAFKHLYDSGYMEELKKYLQ